MDQVHYPEGTISSATVMTAVMVVMIGGIDCTALMGMEALATLASRSLILFPSERNAGMALICTSAEKATGASQCGRMYHALIQDIR